MSASTLAWSLRTDRSFFTQAHRQGSRFFMVYFQPHSGFESAIVVPKTVLPKATDRNQLKRRVKAILAKMAKTTQLSNLKLVLVARHPATTLTYQQLTQEITQLITRL